MTITDVIREADTNHVIYFLLSSYVNASRCGDRLKSLPERVAALPLTSATDVKSRFEILILELDAASKRLDDQACIMLKDALTIFGTALNRLQSLDGRRYWPLELEVGSAKTPPRDLRETAGPAL
ncbi:MAG: hypothetical protein K8S22_08000 [Betaproteobacteria bacterium]|nr:hypothetical protein [Betaproteobacteria bacterium]